MPRFDGVNSFASTSAANFYSSLHVIQPPPGFTPLLYPAYDEQFLPQPEFKKINSNLLKFKSFITNFETRVKNTFNIKNVVFCCSITKAKWRSKLNILVKGTRWHTNLPRTNLNVSLVDLHYSRPLWAAIEGCLVSEGEWFGLSQIVFRAAWKNLHCLAKLARTRKCSLTRFYDEAS